MRSLPTRGPTLSLHWEVNASGREQTTFHPSYTCVIASYAVWLVVVCCVAIIERVVLVQVACWPMVHASSDLVPTWEAQRQLTVLLSDAIPSKTVRNGILSCGSEAVLVGGVFFAGRGRNEQKRFV